MESVASPKESPERVMLAALSWGYAPSCRSGIFVSDALSDRNLCNAPASDFPLARAHASIAGAADGALDRGGPASALPGELRPDAQRLLKLTPTDFDDVFARSGACQGNDLRNQISAFILFARRHCCGLPHGTASQADICGGDCRCHDPRRFSGHDGQVHRRRDGGDREQPCLHAVPS